MKKKSSESDSRKSLTANQRELLAAVVRSAPGKSKKLMLDILEWFTTLPANEQERIFDDVRAKNGDAAIPAFQPDDYVYQFNEDFPKEPNTLFADKDNQLFLGYVEEGKVSDVEEVTLTEALDWWCRCLGFSVGGSGSVELLCKLASQRMKEFGID
jgi:hypothetical protein